MAQQARVEAGVEAGVEARVEAGVEAGRRAAGLLPKVWVHLKHRPLHHALLDLYRHRVRGCSEVERSAGDVGNRGCSGDRRRGAPPAQVERRQGGGGRRRGGRRRPRPSNHCTLIHTLDWLDALLV